MKVLMIGPSRNVKGGMTTVVNNYFNYGLNKKVDLRYIETCGNGNFLYKVLKEIKGKVQFIRCYKKYDIIHIHMASRRSTYRKIKYAILAKKAGKKVVFHIHGGGFINFYNNECKSSKKKYIISILKKANKIITLSDEMKSFLVSKKIEPSKIIIINNGVFVPKKNKKEKNNNYVFLGRITENKGIFDLINVVKKVIVMYPDFKLLICGSGENQRLCALIDKYKLKNNVEFIGWINGNQRDQILKKSSYFILPSYFEAMPMSLLEAMAYQVVPIATNVGSISTIIKDDNIGYIYEAKDNEKLYKIILEAKNNNKFATMSDNCYQIVKKQYNIEENINSVMKIYLEVSNRGDINEK